MPPQRNAEHVFAVEKLSRAGLAPKAIYDRLVDEMGEENAPSYRTVQRIVERMAKDLSGPWSLAEVEGLDEATLSVVLEALAQLIEDSSGQKASLTRAEAGWIAKLRKAAPDLDPGSLLTLARWYAAKEPGKTVDLDVFVAFHPWRTFQGVKDIREMQNSDFSDINRYLRAVNKGRLPVPEPFTVDDVVLFAQYLALPDQKGGGEAQ
jgi:hypothetical protein